MAHTTEVVLLQKFCHAKGCGALFLICRHCDRGHRYCSERCRTKARREQRRAANRRHQQSPEGRLDHRDRQRAYRQRLAQARVTDQGSGRDFSSDNVPTPESTIHKNEEPHTVTGHRSVYAFVQAKSEQVFCIVCGRQGSFVKPFDRWG